LKSDHLYYFPSNTESAEIIANMIRSVTHNSVHEIMAGTGWLCKALQEQSIIVTASDDFSFIGYKNNCILDCSPDSSCESIAEQHGVDRLDALKAIETTDSKVILLCLPLPNKQLFTEIFEACHQYGKMIITIACGSESIKSEVVNYVMRNEFDVGCLQSDKFYRAQKLANARMHHIKQVNIGDTTLWCGFYKSIPKWYRLQQLQNTTCTIV
ncbi:MAG: hypothetical protein HAW66_04630, partial [Shewanella sp.]|nr:hypothetical protein [Shewanella sp.]